LAKTAKTFHGCLSFVLAEIKQFQNSFETVLFQFRFGFISVVGTVYTDKQTKRHVRLYFVCLFVFLFVCMFVS